MTALSAGYGALTVLRDVSFKVGDGEAVALVGANGAGKTTLLNLIAGDLTPTAGEIEVLGEQVTGWHAHRRANLGLGRLFQVPSIYPELTPAQNMRLALSEAFREIELPPELARFSDIDDMLARDLSLADQRALELAVAIGWGPIVVLLDEPAAGLSHEDALRLAELLRRVNARLDCTLVVVEHDMEIVRELADRVVVMANGRILTEGSMDEVAAHEEVRSAYLGNA